MDTLVIAALITGAATVIAALIAILPRRQRKEPVSSFPSLSSPASEFGVASGIRAVYYQGAKYRFLNFGGKSCRIEPMEDGRSFLAPTHELFHDPQQIRRITRESIVVRV